MAQKETIEFVAKVDDRTNQVVPTSQTGTAIPKSPVVPVDPQAGLQETINASLSKEAAEGTLEELIQSSIAREAQLKVLRAMQADIKKLEIDTKLPPPELDLQLSDDDLFNTLGGGGDGIPPNEPPTTGFFDDEDNRFDNIPDLTEEAEKLQLAFEDLIRSFDKVDTGPEIDPQRFDETTAEFDKTFADSEKLDETIAELTESFGKPLELLGIATPQLELFIKGLVGAVAGLSSVIVATQLYSSVLAAAIENFGELSADVKQAQAKTEVARIQQQLRFAEEFGEALADLEEGRNNQRESGREFLANLMAAANPWLDAISAGFTALYDVLNLLLAVVSPFLELFKLQMKILEQIYKTISFIANAMNPFKWFESDEEGDNTSVWDNITAPENFLNVDNIRPTNVNGRDVYSMDDLMKKNL